MAKEITHTQGYDVEVAWARGQESVRIATVMPDVVGGPRDLAEMISQAPGEFTTARGLHATLADRASVNKLIRDLQHARDAAFGKDA